MGFLYLDPVRCPCGGHGRQTRTFGLSVHGRDEPCPFLPARQTLGGFVKRLLGVCCRFDALPALQLVEALGRSDIATDMRLRLSADVAHRFASRFEYIARDLDERQTPCDAKVPSEDDDADKKRRLVCFGPDSNYDKAVATLKQAAHWYREIGARGYGVEPWSEERCC